MSTVSDLDTWRLFFKVVAKGSIAKVAEEMRIEPSSISRRLNKLESELGTDLFQRRGKNLVLTAAGSLAFSRMRRVVFDAASVFKDLQDVHHNEQKHITIVAPIGFSEEIISQALGEYIDMDSTVSFSLRSLGYLELISPDSFSNFDVVITPVQVNISTRDYKLICGLENLLVATPEYLAAQKYPIRSPRDLREHHTFSYYSQGREMNFFLRKGTESFPLHKHSVVRFNHPGAVKNIVLASKGIGLYCPKYFYIKELLKGKVVPVLSDWTLPLQPIYLSRKDRNRIEVERFVNWFCDFIQDLPGLVPPDYEGYWVSDSNDTTVV